MHKLQSNQHKQLLLFKGRDIQEEVHQERLNNIIDNINKRNGKDTLNWGSSTIEQEWEPRRTKLSYLKTTIIESIPTVYAN